MLATPPAATRAPPQGGRPACHQAARRSSTQQQRHGGGRDHGCPPASPAATRGGTLDRRWPRGGAGLGLLVAAARQRTARAPRPVHGRSTAGAAAVRTNLGDGATHGDNRSSRGRDAQQGRGGAANEGSDAPDRSGARAVEGGRAAAARHHHDGSHPPAPDLARPPLPGRPPAAATASPRRPWGSQRGGASVDGRARARASRRPAATRAARRAATKHPRFRVTRRNFGIGVAARADRCAARRTGLGGRRAHVAAALSERAKRRVVGTAGKGGKKW